MTLSLKNYVEGAWREPQEPFRELRNPTSGETLAHASSAGVDYGAALEFAREQGGRALRGMTFAERGKMIAEVSRAIHEHREELLDLSTSNNGTTRSDGKFDLDGATGTLMYYAKLGEALGERKILPEDDAQVLARSPRWVGRHVFTPRRGVAVLINAFNFPAWGFGEKAAAAWLAGMPVLNKPATSTALVAARIAEIVVESGAVPEGVFSSVVGSAGDLLDHLDWQDVVAFTGSADTGLAIRGHRRVLERNVRVNVEADSVNAAVIGKDLSTDDEAFDMMVAEVARDVTQKAGQKCTAIRRLLVPEALAADVEAALIDELKGCRVGEPAEKGVRVGPLAVKSQVDDTRGKLDQLRGAAELVWQSDAPEEGYFHPVTLLRCTDSRSSAVHELEAFAPVLTLVSYSGEPEEAAELVGLGGGSLVTSVYSNDKGFARRFVEEGAAFLGRVHLGCDKVAELSVGPGTVLPSLQHGGPGRAGGGLELGGLSGLRLYMQRTAVQGFSPWLEEYGEHAPI